MGLPPSNRFGSSSLPPNRVGFVTTHRIGPGPPPRFGSHPPSCRGSCRLQPPSISPRIGSEPSSRQVGSHARARSWRHHFRQVGSWRLGLTISERVGSFSSWRSLLRYNDPVRFVVKGNGRFGSGRGDPIRFPALIPATSSDSFLAIRQRF